MQKILLAIQLFCLSSYCHRMGASIQAYVRTCTVKSYCQLWSPFGNWLFYASVASVCMCVCVSENALVSWSGWLHNAHRSNTRILRILWLQYAKKWGEILFSNCDAYSRFNKHLLHYWMDEYTENWLETNWCEWKRNKMNTSLSPHKTVLSTNEKLVFLLQY